MSPIELGRALSAHRCYPLRHAPGARIILSSGTIHARVYDPSGIAIVEGTGIDDKPQGGLAGKYDTPDVLDFATIGVLIGWLWSVPHVEFKIDRYAYGVQLWLYGMGGEQCIDRPTMGEAVGEALLLVWGD